MNQPTAGKPGPMPRRLGRAFVAYHRGLAKMPLHWKPWLLLLLCVNMIVPVCYAGRLEARVVFVVALLNGLIFVILTAISGFSRLLGLGHVLWLPLVYYLWMRWDQIPANTLYGLWIRAVTVLNTVSLILDASNVIRYIFGDRSEIVPVGMDSVQPVPAPDSDQGE